MSKITIWLFYRKTIGRWGGFREKSQLGEEKDIRWWRRLWLWRREKEETRRGEEAITNIGSSWYQESQQGQERLW